MTFAGVLCYGMCCNGSRTYRDIIINTMHEGMQWLRPSVKL